MTELLAAHEHDEGEGEEAKGEKEQAEAVPREDDGLEVWIGGARSVGHCIFL